jgi:hypothetical protein
MVAVAVTAMFATGSAQAVAVSSGYTGGIGRSQATMLRGQRALGDAPESLQQAFRRATFFRPDLGLPPPTVGARGYSVAVSGDDAIIGAPGVNNGAGEVLIFGYSGGRWKLQATFGDPRNMSLDEYGWSVAISDSPEGVYAAVGAEDENSDPDVVYVYDLAHGAWQQQMTLPDPRASNQDGFGDAVAISGSTLVVGSMCINNESGQIYIYERFAQSWDLVASDTNPSGMPNEWFGESVSMSGGNFIVGASGEVYQFTENSKHHWRRAATITNPGSAKDNFGWAVSLSGTTAAIGAPGGIPGSPVPSPFSAGITYVFTLQSKIWSLRGKVRPPAGSKGDQFGYSVATTGSTVLVGMPLYGAAHCGRAFSFKHVGTHWHLQAPFYNKGCTGNSEYGFAVGLSGASGAFGAPFCNSQRGASYLLKIS